ncbi:MAG: hypothetical protein H7X97_06285, partial [Opitutaceae bacterium]|nr:hypothetical protein [Verrucomicrobiales bacterium]
MEGFTIDTAHGAVTGTGTDAPMPVKWLYVLEDGQMVAPTGGGTTATVAAASGTNSIIGRVAFWTDDETSKVNINTASEGAFWDWPKAASYDEMQFAGNPPVAGEYNRLSGHPAMTSLSAIFPGLDPGYRWDKMSSYRTQMKTIMDIVPRVRWDDASSRGGTYPVQKLTANYDSPTSAEIGPGVTLIVPNKPILPDTDRLFATADELLFTPQRALNTGFTLDEMRRTGFFVTANSRAPETTLFETPRISLWPVTWPFESAHYKALSTRQDAAFVNKTPTDPVEQNTWMRAEERLLAFVSTLNKQGTENRYYFQRQNPDSPTADLTIARNGQILSYLNKLTEKNEPGYGGSFQAKYPQETGAPAKPMDFILANVFNMTRSMVNQYTLLDTGRMLYSYTPVSFHRYQTTNAGGFGGFIENGAFNAVPLRINLGSGPVTTLSEFPRLTEAAMVFFATERETPRLKTGLNAADPKVTNNPYNWDNLINVDPNQTGINPANTKQPNTHPTGSMTKFMRMALILDFSQINGATNNNNPVFWVKIIAGSAPTVGGISILKSGSTLFNYADNGDFDSMPTYMRPMVERRANGTALQAKKFDNSLTSSANYAFISDPIETDSRGVTFSLTGGQITVELYAIKNGDPNLDPTGDPSLMIDRYEVDLSSWRGNHPTPLMPYWQWHDYVNQNLQCPNPIYDSKFPSAGPTKWAATEVPQIYRGGFQNFAAVKNPPNHADNNWTSYYGCDATTGSMAPHPAAGSWTDSNPVFYAARALDKNGVSRPCMSDFPTRVNFWMAAMDRNGRFDEDAYAPSDFLSENSKIGLGVTASGIYEGGGYPVTTTMDTILSVVADQTKSGSGDTRLASQFKFKRVDEVCGPKAFIRMPQTYLDAPRLNYQWHTLGRSSGNPSHTGIHYHLAYSLLGTGLLPSTPKEVMGAYNSLGAPAFDTLGLGSLSSGTFPVESIGVNSSVGDWSSAPGPQPDGSNIPRLDQDFQTLAKETGAGGGINYVVPYFRNINSKANGLTAANANGYFSPNRQVPSPISILGNLPSSMSTGWQTLLFNPNPSPDFLNRTSHPGAATPPDHLLLDLFWMPVAEPYPISEQFATAGKINMNYQILPFSYIKRKTGMHALLKSTWITALNPHMTEDYKSRYQVVTNQSGYDQTRYRIDIDETLKQLDDEVFSQGKILRSGSEICSLTLVPADKSLTYATTRSSFWPSQLLTSDTARENPYNDLYSRVTTRSNTFTVHWRAQVLRKRPGGNQTLWEEGKDVVASELRGSTLIERYIDPNATNIP